MKHLESILTDSKFAFKIIHHEKPLLSAKEGAEYFGIEVGQTAPTLIIKTDQGFFALVISGSRGKVNFDKLANILGCSKVKLATPKEVKKVTGYEVGAVPPVGLTLPSVLDTQLFNYDFIYGGTGSLSATLKIEPKALTVLNQVEVIFDELN